jgi:hypothetical protein
MSGLYPELPLPMPESRAAVESIQRVQKPIAVERARRSAF